LNISFFNTLRTLIFTNSELTVRIYPGALAEGTIYCPISARKTTTAHEAIERVIDRLQLDRTKCYVLAEVKEFGGEEWILNPNDCPVQRMMLWPRVALEHRPLSGGEDYRFLLRQKNLDGSIHYENSLQMWLQVTEERRRMVERGLLPQPDSQGDHADLCCLPELNEHSLLDNLRSRFRQEKIYTYVGSILIVINPFKFLPIYNPKYVKMYDNHTLGDLEPHIYAVADVAYHTMLRRQRNQCIVISGESGSGKTQSTNFLIHHLTALSQKGFASGVEQIILGAGPVLEAFGNAKTAHNNNSSRFGKFIQVNYQESGTVRGAYVEKYLLEKSRLVNQEPNERNYHVFYYLLAGASEEERRAFHLKKPEEYHYLSQTSSQPRWDSYCDESEPDCFTVEGEDLKHDFERLQLAMEMVGFLPATRKQIFSLLSAILHLGNIRYKKKTYRDDSIDICNPEVLPVVSELLEVREDMLFEALTTRKTVTVGEKLIVPYKLAEAGTVRDSMAKSLYSALFDWIVFRINHALLNIKDLEETTKILSIGVLDIFGFEDFENNSFEQFCINFANERLQHYFNQHIFKLEQEEYRAEGISWMNIDYIDNTGCINLVSKKPTALFHLLDEECNFPQATNQTLLDKFKRQHEGNSYIEFPAVMEPAFIIRHYAGKVKYGVKDFREKNTDHMRPDIVALLKSSKNAFICSLIGIDPSATFRWAVLRAYFRALVAFREAGKRHTHKKTGHDDAAPCAVLKKMDSFSFLQHPVHQRSLEILQRCKEEKYTTSCSPGLGWNGRVGRRSRLPSSGSNTEEDGIFVNSASSRLLERAHDILMRNKNYKLKPVLPKHLLNVKSLKYLSNLTLHDRITKSLLHLHKKKKPPSISAQFQASLNKLMETLGQSEPYFVKCIRSNADKLPLRFDDKLVLRQLRYTGMLETVRIRQSGYNVKYTFKDFVHHFGVLLPEDTSPTRESIQESMSQLDLQPEGYQVGKTKVFLREAERQRLQVELHREVLRLIVMLQQRFRARLERKQFVRMREAAVCIQKCWRSYRSMKEQEKLCDPGVQQRAALCLQTHWRGYRGRQNFRQWREAARVLQRAWRIWICRRTSAAVVIQTAWRCHQAREEKEEEKLLQNGQVNISSAEEEKELPEEIMGLDLSTWEDRSYEQRERSLQLVSNSETAVKEEEEQEKAEAGSSEVQTEANTSAPLSSQAVQERVRRRLEEPSQKTTRSKRECRRMRELEQAKFSLELQKVRASSGGASSPSEDRRWSLEFPPASPALNSPQGTPDSESFKYSFEIPVMDGEPPKAAEEIDNEDPFSPVPPIAPGSDSNMEDVSSSSSTFISHPPAEESLPNRDVTTATASNTNPCKERQGSSRRPVLVVISMQKETPLSEELSPTIRPPVELREPATQTGDSQLPSTEEAPRTQGPLSEADQTTMNKLVRLNEATEERRRNQQQQNEKEMMEQIRRQSEVLEQQRMRYAQCEKEIPDSARTSSSFKGPRPSSLLIEKTSGQVPHGRTQSDSTPPPPHSPVTVTAHGSPKLPQLPPPPFSAPTERRRDHRPAAEGWAPKLTLESRNGSGVRMKAADKKPENGGPKKKARMARTRSDFLTRASSLAAAGDSDEDDYDGDSLTSPRHYTLPLSKQTSTEAGRGEACFSDSDMVASTPPVALSAKAYVFLLFVSVFLPVSFHFCHYKVSLIHAAGQENMSPPCSPDLTLDRSVRDLKENKEASPKVKHRRSVKISSVALEPAQWQNDALQILSCINDYRSMNDFLLKKINDLETEDSKKDTMVDVVFKKALKEFRLNIFNFFSTALVMDDSKDIRYKDLYALFEQILEKTMRQEQRDWRESPVKVWVNTFKVFLDEFMTEYKLMDSTLSKVILLMSRKKPRKKDTDIVEEHNGHIFKSTQYSIPTYCEYCSSLIWMMERACVCKLCRYACHRKCCQKTTTKCKLSSRQFGVEVSRLTNDERTVPLVVEKLINHIEMHGLYTEGIYRKSGSTNKIKELKLGLDNDVENMNLDDYNIHVIASVFKQWLRDLPNPLMTFELYEEFIRAMSLQDKKETIRGVYSVIDQLSRTHLNTLERLIFHLVRISLEEETNRMSANALAIVFAPCILRCPDTTDPLRSVQDISRTTACVELIICEQMTKYKVRLKDISTLEFAENKAKTKLSLIRRSMGKGHRHRLIRHTPSPPASPRLSFRADVAREDSGGEEGAEPLVDMTEQAAMQQEDRVLTEQIENLQKKKEELTVEMLALEPRASDDETLESEASIGTADSSENLNLDSEDTISDFSGIADGKDPRRRTQAQLPDSLDSTDSCSTVSSYSSSSHFQPSPSSAATRRFRLAVGSSLARAQPQPLNTSQSSRSDSFDGGPAGEQDAVYDEQPQFTSRGTYNPEKGRQKLKGARRNMRDNGGGPSRDPPDIPQHLVLYGSKEFMV
uniref:Myosin IXA n=1 Tax=Cyprinodon variegatus TaxID=28743 RepID=A0A3Q2CG75_CYPVA